MIANEAEIILSNMKVKFDEQLSALQCLEDIAMRCGWEVIESYATSKNLNKPHKDTIYRLNETVQHYHFCEIHSIAYPVGSRCIRCEIELEQLKAKNK